MFAILIWLMYMVYIRLYGQRANLDFQSSNHTAYHLSRVMYILTRQNSSSSKHEDLHCITLERGGSVVCVKLCILARKCYTFLDCNFFFSTLECRITLHFDICSKSQNKLKFRYLMFNNRPATFTVQHFWPR